MRERERQRRQMDIKKKEVEFLVSEVSVHVRMCFVPACICNIFPVDKGVKGTSSKALISQASAKDG